MATAAASRGVLSAGRGKVPEETTELFFHGGYDESAYFGDEMPYIKFSSSGT